MSVWFEGNTEIEGNIQLVNHALENPGEHYVGIIKLMPGMTSVELVEQKSDYLIIKTNEGIMKRTQIVKTIETESVVIEFDEDYQAGSKITTKSNFLEEFTTGEKGINLRVVISAVEASGLLGFFYRKFGSANTGNAFLKAYETYFENQNLPEVSS